MKLASSDPDLTCARLAQRQMGLISVSQAAMAGLSPAQISYRRRTGAWRCLLPRVYALAGTPSSWLQRVYAAHLSLGPDAVFCGTTAVGLLGVDDFEKQSDVHAIVQVGVRPTSDWLNLHRVKELDARDVSSVDILPVTTAPRTLLDLCGQVHPIVAERALGDLVHKKLVTVPALVDQLIRNGKRGRRGTAQFRKLVQARAGEPGRAATGFEVDLFALLTRAGFPPPLQQFEIYNDGKFVARPDFCYPEKMIIIEADSYRWHSSPTDWRRDQVRHNQLIALGWAVLRFTWTDLRSPDAFLANLRVAWDRIQGAA
jgi:Protein of unknown function (DUF559)